MPAIPGARVLSLGLTFCMLASAERPSSDWTAVRGIQPGERVEVFPAVSGQPVVRGEFVRAGADDVVVATGQRGEVSIARAGTRSVKVHAPRRRSRNGLMGVAIGAGVGLGVGIAICPYCPNEGHGFPIFPALMAVCVGIGATAFLFTPYRTVYRVPKR